MSFSCGVSIHGCDDVPIQFIKNNGWVCEWYRFETIKNAFIEGLTSSRDFPSQEEYRKQAIILSEDRVNTLIETIFNVSNIRYFKERYPEMIEYDECLNGFENDISNLKWLKCYIREHKDTEVVFWFG